MLLPKSRGRLSDQLCATLRALTESPVPTFVAPEDDVDAALTLWILHELAYAGFEDVDDAAEWVPELLALRGELERDLEARLRARWDAHVAGDDGSGVEQDVTGPPEPRADELAERLFALVAEHDGPSLARFVQSSATREQALDLVRLRSVYHLKEADPTSWVVPRLPVRAKAALVELQYDEYGAGNPNRLHSHLFARGMEGAGLRSERGAYLHDVPLEVLEMNNALSMFGLHRRLRGAAVGHLAAFEATSSVPSRRLAQGFARLGLGQALVDYYDEHVSADAVHDQLAVRSICGTLVEDEPRLLGDVFFGAFTALDLEARFARHLLDRWDAA